MGLLDDGAWHGKVWTGAWTDGSGGTYDAVEPATGQTIAPVGRATPEDVVAAAVAQLDLQEQSAAAGDPAGAEFDELVADGGFAAGAPLDAGR